MKQEQTNLYQFLYHKSLAVIFEVKSCPDSIFSWFFRLKINLKPDRSKLAFYLLIIQVSQLSANFVDLQWKANLWNRQKCLYLEYFSFLFLETLNIQLKYAKQVILNV